MQGRFVCVAVSMFISFLVLALHQVHAVIKADTPLSAIADYEYVLVGKVAEYLPDKPALVVTVIEDIRGKAAFRQLPINCKVDDAKALKENQIEPLLKRFGPDLEIVFFMKPFGKRLTTFAFTNGTWFQLQGTQLEEKDKVIFRLVSAEPYFRKTYKGTTAELVKVLKDHVAGKAKLPPLDPKAEPGLGPEYKKASANGGRQPPDFRHELEPLGTSFAVIPTVGIGAPLFILALLFPTVFGGVFVLFRQWMAFITLISVNSTLLIAHILLGQMRGNYWNTPATLWIVMTIVTFLCTLWAWRRQLNFLYSGDPEAPQRVEHAVLWFMTICCVAATIVTWTLLKPSPSEVGWALTVVMTLGIAVGTIYKLARSLRRMAPFGSPSLATEGVILGTMLLGHLAFALAILGGGTDGKVSASETAAKLTTKIAPVVKKWDFVLKEAGLYVSTPLIDGELIYAAAAYPGFRGAELVCLNRQTGAKNWSFIDDGDFRQVISSPCLADGKLYIGEGFHDDPKCKLYCIDATNGKKLWEFQTKGQTESSPTVAGGRVYVGAGNDGVYCLDAKAGKQIWNYSTPGQGRLLRFGAGMLVVGDRLYCGSGVDRNQKDDKGETAAFCFEAATGKLLWKTPVPFAVWSTPVVKDGMVYLTVGNGDIFTNDEKPGGALVCLDEKTGKEVWTFKVENGIIERPAVDGHRLYFGCRDGQVYCVGRSDGKQRWQRFLETPVIATPVLDSDPVYERTVSVFAASTAGKVCCLNPQTGDIVWTYDLSEQKAFISASPRLVVTRTSDGYRRQLYFGCGIGGGASSIDISAHRPVFYCLEDTLKVE